MNFASLRVIELSCKTWILLSMGNFVSHFREHLGPAELLNVAQSSRYVCIDRLK